MTTKPLTVPLAQAALYNSNHRPPLRSVPARALEPDRSHVDKPAPEVTEMAWKKKMKRSPESIAKMKATLAAKRARKLAAIESGEKVEPAFDGLDLILDILDLCERAKKGLTRSQRVRLKAAVNERL